VGNCTAQRSKQAATGIGGEAGVQPNAWTPTGGEREREREGWLAHGPYGKRGLTVQRVPGSWVRPVKDKERILEFRLIIFLFSAE
jgi:hypothetical protein